MSLVTALFAGGLGLKVLSQRVQTQNQAQVFEFNADIDRQQKTLELERGRLEADKIRRNKLRVGKAQVAAFAGAGVRLTGTPVHVLAETAAELELDVQLALVDANIRGLNAQQSAELNELRARQARTTGFITTGSTLLTQTASFLMSRNQGFRV